MEIIVIKNVAYEVTFAKHQEINRLLIESETSKDSEVSNRATQTLNAELEFIESKKPLSSLSFESTGQESKKYKPTI